MGLKNNLQAVCVTFHISYKAMSVLTAAYLWLPMGRDSSGTQECDARKRIYGMGKLGMLPHSGQPLVTPYFLRSRLRQGLQLGARALRTGACWWLAHTKQSPELQPKVVCLASSPSLPKSASRRGTMLSCRYTLGFILRISSSSRHACSNSSGAWSR